MADTQHSETPEQVTRTPPDSSAPEIPFGDFGRSLDSVTPHQWAVPALLVLHLLVFGIMVTARVSPEEPAPESLLQRGANFGPLTVNGPCTSRN